MEKITPSQLREIHKLLLSAIHKTEALYKELPEDSLKHETLFRLSSNIESVIFNALYDANDLLFDETCPYPPIEEFEFTTGGMTTSPEWISDIYSRALGSGKFKRKNQTYNQNK